MIKKDIPDEVVYAYTALLRSNTIYMICIKAYTYIFESQLPTKMWWGHRAQHYDFVELFAGRGWVSDCMASSGRNVAKLDILLGEPVEGKQNAFDLTTDAGFWYPSLVSLTFCHNVFFSKEGIPNVEKSETHSCDFFWAKGATLTPKAFPYIFWFFQLIL